MKTGIYKIKNLVNGKVYVGSAVNINERWRRHRTELKCNKHHSIKLQRSYNKHGINSFVLEIIKECDKENLIQQEQYYIDSYNSYNNGYNCNPTAGSNFGKTWSNEYKNKMSKAVAGEKNGMFGKKHSEETKLMWSKKRKGYKHTDQAKKNMSESRTGRKNHRYNPIPIIQYDLQENFIKEWKDLIELKENGFVVSRYITDVCKGLHKSAYGYKWKFKV